MENMVANSSAIRAMFEEGNRLAKIYDRLFAFLGFTFYFFLHEIAE